MSIAAPWPAFESEFSVRMQRAGFRHASPPPSGDFPETTSGEVELFESSYALLLLVRKDNIGHEPFLQLTEHCVDWMSRVLKLKTQRDLLLDGYVVLALAKRPTEPRLQEAVLSFELGRQVCRRHVVWPGVSGSASTRLAQPWSTRLDRITVLALPDTGPLKPAEPLTTPTSELVAEIEQQLNGRVTYREIARRLVEEA